MVHTYGPPWNRSSAVFCLFFRNVVWPATPAFSRHISWYSSTWRHPFSMSKVSIDAQSHGEHNGSHVIPWPRGMWAWHPKICVIFDFCVYFWADYFAYLDPVNMVCTCPRGMHMMGKHRVNFKQLHSSVSRTHPRGYHAEEWSKLPIWSWVDHFGHGSSCKCSDNRFELAQPSMDGVADNIRP